MAESYCWIWFTVVLNKLFSNNYISRYLTNIVSVLIIIMKYYFNPSIIVA